MTRLLLLLVGFLLGRNTARNTASGDRSSPDDPKAPTTPPNPPTPPPSPAPPRYVTFLKHYAVAELAAVIGIPLAVLALAVSAIATRDTARQLQSSNSQLRLAERQARPILTLKGYPPRSANDLRGGFDHLALEVEGPAEDVEARVLTAILLRDDEAVAVVATSDWWKPTGPVQGETARWLSKPSVLAEVNDKTSRKDIILMSIIEVSFLNVFGATQHAYFSSVDGLAGYWEEAPYGVHRMRNESQTQRCVESLGIQFAIRNIDRFYRGAWARRVNKVVEKRLAAGAPITVADIEKSSIILSPSSEEEFPSNCFPA